MKDYQGLDIHGTSDPFDDFWDANHDSNGEPLDAIDDELDVAFRDEKDFL